MCISVTWGLLHVSKWKRKCSNPEMHIQFEGFFSEPLRCRVTHDLRTEGARGKTANQRNLVRSFPIACTELNNFL